MTRPKKKELEAAPPPSPPWVELPAEITADILQRLGAIEILVSAQRVCTTWWNVCQDPSMWRVIDMRNDGDIFKRYDLDTICEVAVDRSQGQCVKINIENFGTRELLFHIAQRSSQLRYLRLVLCHCVLDGCLAAAAKNFPLLEELHLFFSVIGNEDVEIIGRSCPLLKSFTSNAYGFLGFAPPKYKCNTYALNIAMNMPELRHLTLFGQFLTNDGLHAILDCCPHLESLDLRHCYNIDLEGDLGRRCKQQIVDLKGPRDSTYGYEFDAQIFDQPSSGIDDPYEDDDYMSSDDDSHSSSDNSIGQPDDEDDYNDYIDDDEDDYNPRRPYPDDEAYYSS